MDSISTIFLFFFFNDTATTEIYTLSLHDALPISPAERSTSYILSNEGSKTLFKQEEITPSRPVGISEFDRSEEHTSELQSPCNLVYRLLLEKKKKQLQSRLASRLQSSDTSSAQSC